MTRALAALGLGVLASCGAEQTAAGRVHATVATPTGDTLTLSVPLAGQPCAGGGGMLLHGIEGTQGVLVWVFPAGQQDTGAFTIYDPEADVAGRHARVTVRYETEGMVHALALDSGTVRLEASSPARGRLGGSGLALGAGRRPLVRGTFRAIPVGTDPVRCRADSAPGS